MIELQLLGIAGVLIHYFKEWVLADKKGENYNLRKALPTALLSLITTFIVIYLKDDVSDFFVITKFGAVMVGYIGNSLLFSLIDTKKPKDLPTI